MNIRQHPRQHSKKEMWHNILVLKFEFKKDMTGKIISIIIYLIVVIVLSDCSTQRKSQLSSASNNDRQLQIKYFNGVAEFQKMMEFQNVSAINLYGIINRWTIDAYNSPGSVIVRNEEEIVQVEGIQPGIILQKFPRTTAGLKYKFRIEIEDSKICLTMFEMEVLTDLNNKYPIEEYIYEKNGSERSDKQALAVKEHAIRVANVLVNSLEIFFVENGVERKWD